VTKPFVRFLWNLVPEFFTKIVEEAWVLWQSAWWQSYFSYGYKWISTCMFLILWQILVNFSTGLDILLTVHLSIIYSLFPTWYTVFLFMYIRHKRQFFLNGRVTNTSGEGGEYHRLHVQFGPPDDGTVRPETCRGKKITVIVRKQKSSVSSWK